MFAWNRRKTKPDKIDFQPEWCQHIYHYLPKAGRRDESQTHVNIVEPRKEIAKYSTKIFSLAVHDHFTLALPDWRLTLLRLIFFLDLSGALNKVDWCGFFLLLAKLKVKTSKKCNIFQEFILPISCHVSGAKVGWIFDENCILWRELLVFISLFVFLNIKTFIEGMFFTSNSHTYA